MKRHKISAILATAAVATASGLGIAQAQTDGGKANPSAGSQTERKAQGKRGPGKRMRTADMAAALATALGVETAKVQSILDANRPAKPAAGERPARGAKPDHSKLIAALADGLGLSTEKVQAALEATRPAKPAGR